MYDLSSSSFLKSSISQKEQFSNGAILKWSISQMEHFSNGAILKSNISQMEHFSNEAILKSNISQMEHFSNGAILKSNISQMEQFSNGAFWGRHPMPYFKIPRTEKYGMRCARWLLHSLSPKYSPSISSSLPSRIDALCTCHEPLWRKKQNWHMLKNLHI